MVVLACWLRHPQWIDQNTESAFGFRGRNTSWSDFALIQEQKRGESPPLVTVKPCFESTYSGSMTESIT